MNNQTVSKLKLLLMGLQERFNQNKDFFNTIEFSLKSGTKTFKGNISEQNEILSLSFNGTKEEISINDLASKISKIVESYEIAEISYKERGKIIKIEADNKNIKMKTEDTVKEDKANLHNETSTILNREYYIKVGQADELLKEIGILGQNGKVKNDMIRKYNQIDHFIELMHKNLVELTKDKANFTVMDCGCGKSYLTFVLNYYIKEVLKRPCHFIGVDYSKIVIDASKKMAQNLGYKNMEFHTADLNDFVASRQLDLVITLHACDTATDMALATAVNNNAKYIVSVPCCQAEILNQYSYEPFSGILKHGVFKARMADTFTDGLRCMLLEAMGYTVSAIEYISPLETPKNIMISAVKNKNFNKELFQEYTKARQLLNVNPTFERLLKIKGEF